MLSIAGIVNAYACINVIHNNSFHDSIYLAVYRIVIWYLLMTRSYCTCCVHRCTISITYNTSLHWYHWALMADMYKTNMGHLNLFYSGYKSPWRFTVRKKDWSIWYLSKVIFILLKYIIWHAQLHFPVQVNHSKCIWNPFWFRVLYASLQCRFLGIYVSLLTYRCS